MTDKIPANATFNGEGEGGVAPAPTGVAAASPLDGATSATATAYAQNDTCGGGAASDAAVAGGALGAGALADIAATAGAADEAVADVAARAPADDPLAAPTGTRRTLSGMEAAAYGAYALTEVATIFPITPASHMSEQMEAWSVAGVKNAFGEPVVLKEMQSEKGAAGAMHGALSAGALASTFTASQGLMLMIPNMYKMAGELLPGVLHVTARSLAAHALSIFGDHQDVMATRATGCAMLASANVQECMDLSVVAHLSAIEGSLPFVHFFDGFRTSDEISTVQTISRVDIASLVSAPALARFRARAMDPLHPTVRGTAQDSDIYFQNREAANSVYDALPAIVERNMQRLGALTGRTYNLFDYVGAPDAEAVVVTLCSSADVVEPVVDRLCAAGYKVGLVKVRLFRPFAPERLMSVIPQTARVVCALDRTKEPGSQGEPLLQDVAMATLNSGRRDVRVIGGRYGLSSKDFTPSMAADVLANALAFCDNTPSPSQLVLPAAPLARFTVGIDDDLTRLSLPADNSVCTLPANTKQAVFWGFGSDGTVGASRQLAHMLGDTGAMWAQGYSWYDSKKSGGLTISYLRMSASPIVAPYLIDDADYVACHKDIYVRRGYPLGDRLAPGGTFVLNSAWSATDMDRIFPDRLKRELAAKCTHIYNIDAAAIAARVGLGSRINMIMEAVYLHLAAPIDYERAISLLKDNVAKMYAGKGKDVVAKNLRAIDEAPKHIRKIAIPKHWAHIKDGEGGRRGSDGHKSEYLQNLTQLQRTKAAPSPNFAKARISDASETLRIKGGEGGRRISDSSEPLRIKGGEDSIQTHEAVTPYNPDTSYVDRVLWPMENLQGDLLPTSAFAPDGIVPLGGSAWEKRTVAREVPDWDPYLCIQCFQCAFVCPHAAIRPYLATDAELKGAPESFITVPTTNPKFEGLHLRIQNYPQDCVGCGSCAYTCPAPGKALHMQPLAGHMSEQRENLKFAQDNISVKDELVEPTSALTSQLQQPLLQFSGACAGCGETPNVKLLTQLFGDRLVIANATGCSSIWGGYAPASPYCTNSRGRGPAWGNSLFEDNAEYAFGIMKGIHARRRRLEHLIDSAVAAPSTPPDVAALLKAWQAVKDNADESLTTGTAAADAICHHLHAKGEGEGEGAQLLREIYKARDMFQKKSVWAVGGDGWAFDIDYGGLDAVLASGEDINVLVLDTEGYSNTGGEMSKATQLGSVSTFSLMGKDTPKKRLARMCIQYDYVYVAQVCFGADMNQIVRALREAESYPGPSIVVALCPCISWGIKAGMGEAVGACRDAVKSGYWTLWRFDPRLAAAGKNPLTIDSKPPQGKDALRDFLMGQNRFASLAASAPARSAMLQSELAKERATNREELDNMQEIYTPKNN